MSLLDTTPSPMPQVVAVQHPSARREPASHVAVRRLRAVGPYDHEAESSLPMLLLPPVSTLEASLIVTALRGSAFVPCRELGERIEADLRARRYDWTPADGIPRGTA